tara:strand:+ start:454 stop:912 length:459 start_codon:yes stop_codon:yes gene_type:complete
MKITVWMSEQSLDQFKNNERVTGDVYNREPGSHANVLQVQLTLDEYYQIKDLECCGTGCCDVESEPNQESGNVDPSWSCDLPDGADWGIKYIISEPTSLNELKQLVNQIDPELTPRHKSTLTYTDVQDIAKSVPNNYKLGLTIRQLVNNING